MPLVPGASRKATCRFSERSRSTNKLNTRPICWTWARFPPDRIKSLGVAAGLLAAFECFAQGLVQRQRIDRLVHHLVSTRACRSNTARDDQGWNFKSFA